MISIDVKTTGSAPKWFRNLAIFSHSVQSALEKVGEVGVEMLANATPKDTGMTAMSWRYEVTKTDDNSYSLTFHNSHMSDNDNTPVAILIQYGHATYQGSYIAPNDFINPVMTELCELFENGFKNGVSGLCQP